MKKLFHPYAERISVRGALRRPDGGFTMLELLVTIVIAGILATIAVPAFNNVIALEHAKGAASELYTSLVTARSEAIRLDQPVTLSQAAGGWKNGWTTVYGANPTAVDNHGATSGISSFTEASGAVAVTYFPSGRLNPLGTTLMFVVTATTGSSTSSQCVSVDPTGTPYIQAGVAC